MKPRTSLAAACAAAAIGWSLPATAQTDSSLPTPYDPSFDHAASCVAAMKPRAAELADRFVDGDDTVRTELVEMTVASMAIVSAAVSAGLTKSESESLLASAAEFQESVPAEKLQRLVAACLAEGDALVAGSEAVSRETLWAAARRRVERLRVPAEPR